MLLVANDAHNGAVVELDFGAARGEVCCSKRRDARRDAGGTSVWKRGAVWNTCNNNNNNKSLLTLGRCGYCGGDTPGLVRSMDAPESADSGAWGVALTHTHTLMRAHTLT